MALDNVSSGDPFPLTRCDKYEEVRKAVNKVNASSQTEDSLAAVGEDAGTVRVRNMTGEAIKEKFRVVALADTTTKPKTGSSGVLDPSCPFAGRLCYDLEEIDPDKTQTLAILRKPLAPEAYGMAVLMGVSQVLIDITDTEHKYATLKSEQPTDGSAQLESATAGEFEIVTIPRDEDTGDLLDGKQWCTVRFPVVQAGYGGMFAVVRGESTGGTFFTVVDGADSSAGNCGIAVINGERFDVAVPEDEIETSDPGFIYLQATTTDDDPVTIETPTFESSETFPDYEDGKLKHVLARVVNGKIIQEHHGVIYGTIYGDCS